MNTVVAAKLRFPQDLFDVSFIQYGGSAVADLTLDDGTVEHFGWFHDEIRYTPDDFVGKTMDEIRQMHIQRDVAYIRGVMI